MMHRSIGSLILALAATAATAAAAAACGTGSSTTGAGQAPAVGRSPEDLAADGEAPDDEAADADADLGTAPVAVAPSFAASGRQHPRVSATTASPLELDPPDRTGAASGAAAGCEHEHYRAPAGARLELHAAQSSHGRAIVEVALHNAGTEPVCIYSHIHTHELQNDWLHIQYADGARYHHVSRVIELDDAREKSYPVSLLLGPGETLWTSIDLDQWASRSRNGSEPLPTGSLHAEAVYDSTRETDVWSGRLRSAPFELKIK
jgi:hypothetical protein